ncbi:hypothetical protein PHMEG_00036906 [Phytophthora megakarya]|uniref:DDE-1 domain-containing protein n=1 Tax=Phytophthora megakarya TaxID=4795 RepID=A0A225UM61_9STRA|nr:hypothetical protein PHMEG_00036906 [Phytophthora megakarya]
MKKKGAVSIEHMVQRIANRYGFTSQKPQVVKKSYENLEESKALFAIEFWKNYNSYWGGGVLNVDETVIMFDVPPIKAWAGRGRKDSARILGANKHAGRMTAVRTVRDNDKVVKNYLFSSSFVAYLVAASSRMNLTSTWTAISTHVKKMHGWIVRKLLKFEIDDPSVLIVDNFECHVSEEGQGVVADGANAMVVPFPPNSMAVCQPLDVGVMGPLKAKIRNSSGRSIGGTAKETRHRAINSTIVVWNSLKSRTIIRSFKKAIPKFPEMPV